MIFRFTLGLLLLFLRPDLMVGYRLEPLLPALVYRRLQHAGSSLHFWWELIAGILMDLVSPYQHLGIYTTSYLITSWLFSSYYLPDQQQRGIGLMLVTFFAFASNVLRLLLLLCIEKIRLSFSVLWCFLIWAPFLNLLLASFFNWLFLMREPRGQRHDP